jgi:hypothetical protein
MCRKCVVCEVDLAMYDGTLLGKDVSASGRERVKVRVISEWLHEIGGLLGSGNEKGLRQTATDGSLERKRVS